MAHYTGHTFTLTELNTIEQQKSDFLDSLNIKLASPDLLVKDMALMLKSLEVMENLEHLEEYKQFIINVAKKSAEFVNPTELVSNGGFDVIYNTNNLIQNSSFSNDAFEIELVKNSGFNVPVDLSRPWSNGIAYKFDILSAEGTEIIRAYTDGQQTAISWFETQLKPNTRYKFSYDLTVNDVNWDLPNGGKNMVDQLSVDEMVFSEAGGGPDPVTIVISVVEDSALVLPTCDGVVVPFDNSVEYYDALGAMEETCVADDSIWNYNPSTSSFYCDTGTGYPGDGSIDQAACYANNANWYPGNLTNPNTQNHSIIPYHIEAREGDTLIFTNPVGNYLVHNAVSDDNISFTSPDMNPGDTWNWDVDGYHDLYFHCTFHPLEEGRISSTTNHRYVYNVDHGLNPGDTIKMDINYGSMINLPSLAKSYSINITLPNVCTSLGGAGDQTAIDSLYHDLSISQIVTFQSGEVETDPNAGVVISVFFSGGNAGDTIQAAASATVTSGEISSLSLDNPGQFYSAIPQLYITGSGGSGAEGSLEFDGSVTEIFVSNIGDTYTSVPTIEISAPDVATLGNTCTSLNFLNQATCEAAGETWTAPVASVQATATCTLTLTGEIDVVTITETGSGYHTSPDVVFVGGAPNVVASATAAVDGYIYSITLTSGGSGYGAGVTGGVSVGERKWEEYIVTGVQKGTAGVDVYLDDVNQIGHVHTATITPTEYTQIQASNSTIIVTNGDATGHTHAVTFDWSATANSGLGGMVIVGMTGGHTHGLQEYFDISGGTKIELTNFGHYHEILITEADEAALKASPLTGTSQDDDGTWSAYAGLTMIKTSDFGTSDPQHFHTVEFGCLDPATDTYLIIEIDQHIHDFGRVWYPGSSQFNIGFYNYALGGDDLNPVSIAFPFTDLNGFVKKEKGIESDAHGLYPGNRVHFQNVYNGIHHGNTNYWVDYVIDADHFALTEVVIYPLENSQGTTPTEFNVKEQYTVVSDLASYRFQVERDITNHVGSPYIEGIQIEWTRANTVKSLNHGLSVGDVVQLPSGPQPYTPSELPGAMRDHTVVALGDGYGPTDNMEITVDTQTSITWADPTVTTVEGAQDSPWYWSWWDHSPISYAPYQVDEAVDASFGGNDGTNGGFDLFRGGTYKFINNAWSPSGHIIETDPISGNPQPMYMHAAGIKAIPGGGWDNLVEAGFIDNSGKQCISMRADHGLTISVGDHNDFVNNEEEPGTWVSDQAFPHCMGLNGWCEEIDVDGWYYNGEDDESTCLALNPTEDPGLAQWRSSQWVGNFAKEFTWKIPEDFGLTGSDGITGLGPFVPPGEVNGAYHVTHDGGLYRFDKSGMIEGTNRTINLYRGGTYTFKINSAGHPIYVTTDDGTHFTPGAYFGEYLLGVENTRAEEGAGNQLEGDDLWGNDDSGVPKYDEFIWTVPQVAPDAMYYQCAWHASMMGTFNILDLPVVNAGDDVVVYFHHGQDNMYTPLHIKDKIVVDNGTSDDFFEVQPTPEYAFPVKGTQAHILNYNNALTATGPGAIPKIQAMNIELGTIQYIDALAMIPGISSEQFLVTNNETGLAKIYLSVDIDERSDIILDNVTFKEVVWTETGSWNVNGGSAYTTNTDAAYIEQIVTGSITDGVTYEVQYDIIESFKDDFGAEIGSITAELHGDTLVQGTANTVVGHYTETLIAPENTNTLRLINTGKGKIDNVSIKERVTGQNAWAMGEGWTSAGAKAYLDGSIASSEVSQTVDITTGNLYEVKYSLGDVDNNNDGMSGRLRLSLGTNPANLISNWNFDIADEVLVNWTTSGPDVNIENSALNFSSANNATASYTFASALVSDTSYEISIDTDFVEGNILNFQVGPGPTGSHNHTFQMTSINAEWLRENQDVNALTFTQTDEYHADIYTHNFTIKYGMFQGTLGYYIDSQTNPEGHDELLMVSETINNPTLEIVVNGVVVDTISGTGIKHTSFTCEPTNTLTLRMNGTGKINSIKLTEEHVAAIDANTDGLNQDGEKVYHVRAGSYDQKIHFVGDIDDNPMEENNPYYANIGFEGSIDNVSIREIEENWTFASQEGGSAYVDQNSKLIYTSGTGVSNRGIAHITFEMEKDMNYKVATKVDRATDSVLKLGPTPDSDTYGSLLVTDTTVINNIDSSLDFVFKAPVSGTCYLTLSTTGNGYTYWDDVSVKTIPNLSSDEYLLLARSMNVMGVPIGGEERWKANHLDMENADYTGQPIAGMRTMESFGETVIEDYYDVNRRSNDILNPPISLSSMDIMLGKRGVASITPSCTTIFGTDIYTSEVACVNIVGTWSDTVMAHCSNSVYPAQIECELDFGWWSVETPGSCSDPLYTSEYGCLGAGTCSDPTYSFQYTCESSGTCTDPVYNNNEDLCLSVAGTCSDGVSVTQSECDSFGICSDVAYTNPGTCVAQGGTWTADYTWTPTNTYTPGTNTWTSASETWTAGAPGFCSDGIQVDQATCEGPRGSWINEVFESCSSDATGATVDNQVDCESPRGTWDATVVAEIDGNWVEIHGDGIDIGYEISLGGVIQTETASINLPYKVKFEIHPDTPLGPQVLVVTNLDEDYATISDGFVVNDTLHIVNVINNNDGICTDNAYTDITSCVESGTCSDNTWTDEISCQGSVFTATCSDPTILDEATCIASGTCSDVAFVDEATCTADGTCANPVYTDEISCVGAISTWTDTNSWSVTGNTWTVVNNTWTVTGNTWSSDSYSLTGADFTNTSTVNAITSSGLILTQTVVFTDENNISFSGISVPGVYTIVVTNEDGSTFTEVNGITIT